MLTRRQALAAIGGGMALRAHAAEAPSAPVAIARCSSYDAELGDKLKVLFDQLGGVGGLVRGKTVTIKLNLTGNPNARFQGLLPGVTHWTHPAVVTACCRLLGEAGAKRIRLVESGSVPADSLEEYMMNGGWDVKSIRSAAPGVEFERTNTRGAHKRYARLKVPFGGYIFPAFDVNPVYEETDVFMTIAKLKHHATAGVTLSLKNSFGVAPVSIYGDEAGLEEPNERARRARHLIFHAGQRGPSRSAPQELHPDSPREAGYRVPRIIVDLVAARPIDLQIIDGIETIAGAEGPFARGVRRVKPGLLVAGRNPVCTDAVAMALMGYDPQADRGTPPFRNCDSTPKLAEAAGIGTVNLARIDVRGVPIREAVFDFEAALKSQSG